MPQDTGVPASPSGQPSETEPCSTVSAQSVAVPNAVAKLRENADTLKAWCKSFDEHVRNASDPLFGRGYGIEEQVRDLFGVTARLAASITEGLCDCASAIEARRAIDSEAGVVADESAVAKPDAPTQVQSQTPHGDS